MRMECMWHGTVWILINKTTPFFCTFQPRKNSGFVLRCLARTLNESARHLDLPSYQAHCEGVLERGGGTPKERKTVMAHLDTD